MICAAKSIRSSHLPQGGEAPPGYERINPAVLKRLDRWDVNLYVAGKKGGRPVLLREAALSVKPERIEQLVAKFDGQVMVSVEDFRGLSTKLLEDLNSISRDATLPWTDRFALLQTASACEVEMAASLVKPDRMVTVSQQIGSSFVALMESAEVDPVEMLHVARHDHYTFTHVTNVCFYSLMLADALGISDRGLLAEIAVGALLHDIGKRHIPVELLHKKSALTPAERDAIQQHPQQGFEELVSRRNLTLPQLLIVYQHHEHVDGCGYPVGLVGEEIHPWARMVAIVDVFDALTGHRPYRKPMTGQAALEFIQQRTGKQFDKEMVQCWSHATQTT